MNTRSVDTVLREAAPYLAFLATEALFAEQPKLWELGEHGRHHTLNDFTLHFQAVSTGVDGFAAHVAYSRELFEDKGFPAQWLADAWRVMRAVGEEHLTDPARLALVDRLDAVVSADG